ncbi:MAG TPA: lysoplasmalogenase [Halieaceae bacterium]|nr:MAG: lysoplasmalogenase [Gammaproteobacteria bacterium]HDY82525.1 lysoplasmalogenase [Halieaceae bacterium]
MNQASTRKAGISGASLLAFSITGLAFVVGIGYLPYPGAVPLKALPILILVGVAWRELQGRVRLLMAAALVLSACGDILLELNLFAPGLGSFLVAQLCYARHFFSRRGTGGLPYLRLALVLLLPLAVSGQVLPETGDLMVPVAVYMTAITVMGLGAALHHKPSALLFTGALLFIASDCMIGINRFVMPFSTARHAIMLTYYLGQLLILWGVLTSEKH